jgi:cytochrome c-type biogenesis protein CcmF
MDITYIGEWIWASKLGNFLIIFSFATALLATIAYSFQVKNTEDNSWKNIARISFILHGISVFGIVILLFSLIVNNRFDFYYVWQHSSSDLPFRYMFSCFWEGQEGSFILWLFWHVILGFILMITTKNWEAPVMAVFASVQAFLSSMLLGVYVLGYKIGSTPFLMMREHPDMMNLPVFQRPNYLDLLEGTGLNPLLQNYWMTIHPPTLFLGFASTLVPFAFAIAGLWTKKHTDWLKPAIPWTYFSIMILGTGILMGGAWAYEALSFGGFWAWDPVENASLVPWLTMVGAAHVMIIHKNKGTTLWATYGLSLATFILILYSTFLTRSGILGDTSVHAFTDLGMSGQLLIYLLFYVFASIILLLINRKEIPSNNSEDHGSSREFWMFIGSLVLVVSAFQISFSTSIPVINKVLGTNLAPPIDAIAHYNSWQLPLAVLLAILMAFTQYLKYKKTDSKKFFSDIKWSLIVSILISISFVLVLQMQNIYHILLLYAAVFAIVANIFYVFKVLKGRIKVAGASVAHVGFSMILLGALVSTSQSVIISQNTSGIDIENLGQEFINNENIMLMEGDTLRMGAYFVTYKGRKKEGVNIYYEVEYFTKNKEGKYQYEFTLNPVVQTNPNMGNVAEPDTRHFLTKDIYTHITYAEIEDKKTDENPDEYKEGNTSLVSFGDSLFASKSIIVLKDLSRDVDKNKYKLLDDDLAVKANLIAYDIVGNQYELSPVFVVRDNYIIPIEDESEALGIKVLFDKIDTETGKLQLTVSEKRGNSKEFIIMKAIIFPLINILWLGSVIMVIGTIMAIFHRYKTKKIALV